jgi:hypothetical protein
MLTDEKIEELWQEHVLSGNRQKFISPTVFARAIETEVLAELAKQEPVAWIDKDLCILHEEERETPVATLERMGWKPLYAAPVIPDMAQKLRDMLQMLLQEPNTKTALFMAEDMLREMIAAAEGKK